MSSASTSRFNKSQWVIVAALITGVIGMWSYYKGFNPYLQVWGEFYWYVDYSRGFIRRGIIGTISAPLRALLHNREAINSAVVVIYHAISIATLSWLCMLAILRASLLKHLNVSFLAIAIFCASPLIPIIAYNTGYVDIIAMLAALAGVLLVEKRQYLPAAVVGTLAALTNEAAIFIWLPVAFLALFGPPIFPLKWDLLQRLVCAFAPPIVVVLIPMIEAQNAARLIISGLPVDQDMREFLITMQYGQNVGQQVATQLKLFSAYSMNFLISTLITQIAPASITALSIWLSKNAHSQPNIYFSIFGRFDWLAMILFSFSPFLLLVFSWDLSRMMVWTNFSAALLLLHVLRAQGTRHA